MKTAKHVQFPFKNKTALRQRYGETLAALGKENNDIVVLDADLSVSTKTSIFREAFPKRHFDMGIAEADMIGTAAGMAAAGLVPYATSFAMFAVGRTYDQIRNAIAYARLPVRIVSTHSGLTVGEDGGSHQMLEDIAMMRVLPNMHVIVPADARETEEAIRFAAGFQEPLYVRLTREKFPDLYTNDYSFELGKWDTVCEGSGELVMFACGIMVSEALEAAALLEKEGISATVVNAASIKPYDEKLLAKLASGASLVVTLEEALVAGGLGGLVSEYTSAHSPVPLLHIGVEDRFGESGTSAALMEGYGLVADKFAPRILEEWKKLKAE